jgi:integrase
VSIKLLLSDDNVASIKPPVTGRIEVFDKRIGGLAVRVSATARSFIFRGRIRGNPRPLRLTIGPTAIGVEAARAEAVRMLQAMTLGKHPNEEKRAAEAAAYTFGTLVDDWASIKLKQKSERYRSEAIRAIKFNLKPLLSTPLIELRKRDVVRVFDPIVERAPQMALRTAAYARAAFAWAQSRDDDLADRSNPFSIPTVDPVKRMRRLTEEETWAIWKAAGELEFPHGPFIRTSLLTLLRREEIAGMRWSEIKDDMWTVPAKRMKGGKCNDTLPNGAKVHKVHLSPAALAVLVGLPRLVDSDFVFWSARTRSQMTNPDKTKVLLDRRVQIEDWRPHDFRRTGVSWLADHGVDPTDCDKLLAHEDRNLGVVSRGYQRGERLEQRARALDLWAAHATGGER